MAAFLDGCRFNPATGGTTDWTYSSVVTGYQSPAAANVVNGRLYKYRAESADLSQWELGEGAYNTGTGVLARTTVLYNSSGTTTKVNFSTVPQVAIVALKEDLISVEEVNSFTSAQQGQARLNIGINQAVSAGANANFNSLMTPGMYYTPDNGSTNSPASTCYWYLHVEAFYVANYVKQTATRLDNAPGLTYTRTDVNGTWGAWYLLTPGSSTGIGHALADTTGGSAASGEVGEEAHAAGSVNYSSGIVTSVTNLTIPAGDFEVYGYNDWSGSGGTQTTDWQTIISSSTTPTVTNGGVFPVGACHNRIPSASDVYLRQTIGPVRLSLATATTFYLYACVVIASGSSYGSVGYMKYRRVR